MPGNMSSYLEQKILNHILRNEQYIPPTKVFIGLVSSKATEQQLEDGILTNEIKKYDGGRQEITFSAASKNVEGSLSKNNIAINFTGMPKEEIAYAILCDEKENGNILYWIPANEIKTTGVDDIYRLKIDDVVIIQD